MTDDRRTQPFARQDPVTGEWAVFAPNRSSRPTDMGSAPHQTRRLPARSGQCPFCPGNESMLERITEQLPEEGDWRIRAVPNKFPVVTPENTTGPRDDGLYACQPGEGAHEVIIEHPRHDMQIPDYSPADMERLIEMYSRRYDALTREREYMLCVPFRNHGEGAGTSLLHPHSQIIVSGVIPRAVRDRENLALEYFDDKGGCLLCGYLQSERQNGSRLVANNDSFTALVPFAAASPCEVWLLPNRRQAEFGEMNDSEKKDMATLLQAVLAGMRRQLGDPDYNYAIETIREKFLLTRLMEQYLDLFNSFKAEYKLMDVEDMRL